MGLLAHLAAVLQKCCRSVEKCSSLFIPDQISLVLCLCASNQKVAALSVTPPLLSSPPSPAQPSAHLQVGAVAVSPSQLRRPSCDGAA